MAACFYIAEEYRRLLAEFAEEVRPGLAAPFAHAEAVYDPLRPLPIGQVALNLDRLRQASTDVPIEWRFGDYLAANAVDMVTARALGSTNIGEALSIGHVHQHIQTNVRSFSIRSVGYGEFTEFHHAADEGADARFIFHSLLAAKLSLLFDFYRGTTVQDHIDRRASCFGSLLQRFSAELDFLDIDFRDSEVVLNIRRDLLRYELPEMGERQRKACDRELQRRSAELPCAMHWADRIKNHIRLSNFADANVDDICDAFRVQRRTLGRLLRDEGTTFTAILTGLRREKALHLVRNTRVPLKRVAAELGFNSDASFNMAFKSWTGTTPMRFRKDEPNTMHLPAGAAYPHVIARQLRLNASSAPRPYCVDPRPVARPLLATFRRSS
jgi:AraC-like DNA-binding protein